MSAAQATVTYKPIPGFPGYRAGDDGSVWSCRPRNGRGALKEVWRRLVPARKASGYLQVVLCPGYVSRRVHHLVLEAFVGPCPGGMECCHRDGDRANNRLPNLRWGTKKENADDRAVHGTVARGERQGQAKVTADVVRRIRSGHAAGERQTGLAKKHNLTKHAVWRIVHRHNWKHV